MKEVRIDYCGYRQKILKQKHKPKTKYHATKLKHKTNNDTRINEYIASNEVNSHIYLIIENA